MSIADKLNAEPIEVSRADFDTTLRNMYKAGERAAALRCVAILRNYATSFVADDIADAIKREFGLKP